MSDDLHARMQRLAADPPPPTGVPSVAVMNRVRKVRRRRTAGVAVLATAAVAAVVAIAGNLNDVDSQPPVLGPPTTSAPVATSPSPYSVKITLKPVVNGRTVSMTVSGSGTVLLPIAEGGELPAQNLMALGQGSAYMWGDGSDLFSSFSDGAECVKAKTPYRGSGSIPPDTHTYPRAGTYTYTYRARFCGVKPDATASVQVTIN
ncbi:hypothetical protein ACIA49_18220 [Kribbella sp. NPDC051587]|uniref:hypothetical protein n=1 Tax=Kribbella sp. NPDC051587 TaxID=3364119 RepID=UPI0037A198D5